MKKLNYLIFIFLLISISGCDRPLKINGIYRFSGEKKEGFNIWIVDGYKVRHKIYQEFLYGGNEQRYIFNPKGEIWIDNAVSCEEYALTLAHELNERHLMAKFGWTYDRSHGSSLAIEVVMRREFDKICRMHEASLHKVSPTDHDNIKEIRDLPDSIQLQQIYRVPVRTIGNVSVWIVDGYMVRKTIFPDFGFSGNDRSYHFIPAGEIWIDGQISCEETEYSIAEELIEREQMLAGKTYSEAYLVAIDDNLRRRDLMETTIKSHPALIIPDSLTRYAGEVDPHEN
ncbi:MAG: hypothetical protein WCK34_11875 [Bacteroidota bacterium]